jgi:hypothetical protein
MQIHFPAVVWIAATNSAEQRSHFYQKSASGDLPLSTTTMYRKKIKRIFILQDVPIRAKNAESHLKK